MDESNTREKVMYIMLKSFGNRINPDITNLKFHQFLRGLEVVKNLVN